MPSSNKSIASGRKDRGALQCSIMTGRTFLCYASVDADKVLSLRDALASKGVHVWMDRTDILPGADWQRSIEAAIRQCEVLVLVLTNASTTSREVQAEWSLALSLGKVIVPLILDASVELPFRLATLQFIHLDTSALPNGLERLVSILPQTKNAPSQLVNSSDAFHAKQEAPERYIEVTLWLEDESLDMDSERYLLLERARFGTVKSMLDHIYLTYLSRSVAPYSYGAGWLLHGPFIVVPFAWLSNPGAPIESVDLEWSSTTTFASLGGWNEWSITSGSRLRERIQGGVFGALATSPALIRALLAHPKSVGYLLGRRDLFDVIELTKAVDKKYSFKMVQFAWFQELAGKVFRETPSAARSDDALKKHWKVASRLA